MVIEDLDKIKTNPVKYANKISIESLVKLLKKLSHRYYYENKEPYVSDEVFDKLRDVLEEKDPQNSFLFEVGAPVRGTKKIDTLPFPMSSFNKIKNDDEKKLNLWLKKYSTGPYVLSDKLDGVSVQLYKDENGKLFFYSRGDYIEGTNISHLIDTIFRKIDLNKMPKSCSVRGELIIEKDEFKKLNTKKKNVRNSVAGLINSKNSIDKDILNISKFVGYSVLSPTMCVSEQLDKLKKWGFETVYYKEVKIISKQILEDILLDRRSKSKFDIDGIVCVDNSDVYISKSGFPDHAFAFKMLFKDTIASTEILDVEWSISKDFYLKPSISIEPVILAGNATVSNATGNNARYIIDNKIGPGAIVRIVRSNEVIPKIIEVLKPAKKMILPKYKYEWTVNEEGEEVDMVADSDDPEVLKIVNIKLSLHFFKTIGIKFISEGIISKLSDAGYETLVELLDADDDDLIEINGIGKKLVKKIRDEIEKYFASMELYTFMAASNKFGRGLGERKLKAVLDMYPNILIEEWNKEKMIDKLLKVDGYQEKSAILFASNFKKFISFYKKINNIYEISRFMSKNDNHKYDNIEQNTDIVGKTFVFTGFRDNDMQKFIEKHKGKVTTSVSKKTSYVIMADGGDEGGKVQKAKELGVTVLTKSQFIKKFEFKSN